MSLLPALTVAFCAYGAAQAKTADAADQVCFRPAEGAVVKDPPELKSRHGRLDLTLEFKSVPDSGGKTRYCFVSDHGVESPTLRLSSGDQLSIHFKNEMARTSSAEQMPGMTRPKAEAAADAGCAGVMTGSSTNLHFHGLALPPVCHQDESTQTLINPGESFDYQMQIPPGSPSGLDWYHPHAHGLSGVQVQGGASGALIIEGIQARVPALASLPEHTFLLRDQLLPRDTANATSPLVPSWDVSINYVPVRFPDYAPATIEVRPGEREFWRFVNAAANTIFSLQVVTDGVAQPLEVYAVDGMPLAKAPVAQSSLYLPPGARVEFVMNTPLLGQTAQLVTQKVDSGPTGDSAPARPLANIVARHAARESEAGSDHLASNALNAASEIESSGLPELKPVRTRMLYFSQNGNGTEGGAGGATKFFITLVGQPVKQFDMSAPPNIMVRQGTVEDWVIQNPTPEDHIFHIHQIHFQLVAVNGAPVDDPTLRDTIRVPHQVGRTPISSVKLRMDFRDANIAGKFVYHCHILDHEDKGMMGSVEVLPANSDAVSSSGAQTPVSLGKRSSASLSSAMAPNK